MSTVTKANDTSSVSSAEAVVHAPLAAMAAKTQVAGTSRIDQALTSRPPPSFVSLSHSQAAPVPASTTATTLKVHAFAPFTAGSLRSIPAPPPTVRLPPSYAPLSQAVTGPLGSHPQPTPAPTTTNGTILNVTTVGYLGSTPLPPPTLRVPPSYAPLSQAVTGPLASQPSPAPAPTTTNGTILNVTTVGYLGSTPLPPPTLRVPPSYAHLSQAVTGPLGSQPHPAPAPTAAPAVMPTANVTTVVNVHRFASHTVYHPSISHLAPAPAPAPVPSSGDIPTAKLQSYLTENQLLTDNRKIIDITGHEKLGEGAHGLVITARAIEGSQSIKVVLKLLKDEGFKRLFLREGKVLKSLAGHKIAHMVPLYDEISHSTHSIFSKYPEVTYRPGYALVFRNHGTDLKIFIEKYSGFLPSKICHSITCQLLLFLQNLHGAKMVHNDFSLKNILIDDQLNINVTDLAMASPPGPINENFAARWYRSPEYFTRQNKFDYAVDMWALACNLCEIVMGAPLFPGGEHPSEAAAMVPFFICELGLPDEDYISICRNKDVFKISPGFLKKIALTKGKKLQSLPTALIRKGASKEEANAFTDFISKMLKWKPEERITAEQALRHPYVTKTYLKPSTTVALATAIAATAAAASATSHIGTTTKK